MQRPVTVGVSITILWVGLGFFAMQFVSRTESSATDLLLNAIGFLFPLIFVWIAVGLSLRIRKTRQAADDIRQELNAHNPKDE